MQTLSQLARVARSQGNLVNPVDAESIKPRGSAVDSLLGAGPPGTCPTPGLSER
jgi:hypothetical protein